MFVYEKKNIEYWFLLKFLKQMKISVKRLMDMRTAGALQSNLSVDIFEIKGRKRVSYSYKTTFLDKLV